MGPKRFVTPRIRSAMSACRSMPAPYRGPGGAGNLRRVLQPGDRVPDVTVFDTDVKAVNLAEFATRGPLLLAFYLYDWTGT
jgi:hypothetical protein